MAPPSGAGTSAALELVDGGFLDVLFDKVDSGELRLTGEGGSIPTMIKAVLERGLQVELAEHLGYFKGDPAGRGGAHQFHSRAKYVRDVEMLRTGRFL